MQPIQFIDLKAQQARIRDSVEKRLQAVLDHGRYIMGPEIKEVEEKLAAYSGVEYCVSCASGTDALLMALMAYDIGPGDAVITTPFTFISTAEVITLLGAKPVFTDIDQDTYNMSLTSLEKVIREGPGDGYQFRGIIPVDLFGQPADYEEICKVAADAGLFVLQDAAQSYGATYQDDRTGSHGDISATSFFPAKPLGCYGDGGAIFTNSETMDAKLRSIRVHGQGSNKYDNVRIGINGRFDTMQAAIMLEKMTIFDDELAARNRVAATYSQRLQEKYVVPVVRDDRSSVWAQYSLLTDQRETVLANLREAQVPTAIYYPKPLHLQDAYQFLGYERGDFPVTERVADQIFSIPMHPYLTAETQDYIINSLLAAI